MSSDYEMSEAPERVYVNIAETTPIGCTLPIISYHVQTIHGRIGDVEYLRADIAATEKKAAVREVLEKAIYLITTLNVTDIPDESSKAVKVLRTECLYKINYLLEEENER